MVALRCNARHLTRKAADSYNKQLSYTCSCMVLASDANACWKPPSAEFYITIGLLTSTAAFALACGAGPVNK